MPRLPAKQREAEKISTQLQDGSFAAAAHDAPSRHAFDAHAISLLSSLSGDKKKRKQTLDAFISALKSKREEFRKEKKTGAGSATEAIEFYQYVLERNAKWKGITGNSTQPKKGCLENRSDTTDSRCKICNLGGDLIHCSQVVCQNSFHYQCVRPPLDGVPPQDWSCAFCDVDYVTGLKPQARKRRTSVAAVRAMEKLKSDFDSCKVPSPTNTDSTDQSPKQAAKRALENIDSPENSSNRSQRQRRVGAQSDPKSPLTTEFKDDGHDTDSAQTPLVAEDTPLINKDDIPQDILRKLSPKSINSNSKHGQFHCKFCMDNEATETCCFCACRVCFSKRDRNSTILCDICDAEYHMDCLSPPLLKLPSMDWFCPTCVNVITKAKNFNKKPKKLSTPTKASKATKINIKSPRPQSKPKVTKAARSMLKATYASKQPRLPCGRFAPKNFNPTPTQPVKRGPGRPPKSAKAVPKTVTPKKPGTGRPRGRPPLKSKLIKKSEAANKMEESARSITSTDTKGVATSKGKSLSKLVPPKKPGRRGRPPKHAKLSNTENSSAEANPPKPTKLKVSSPDMEKKLIPKETIKSETIGSNNNAEATPAQKPLHGAGIIDSSNSKTNTVTPKKEGQFPQELVARKSQIDSISAEEIKKAEAAAVKAVATSTKIDTNNSNTQNTEVASKIFPGTTIPTSVSTSEKAPVSGHKVPRRKPGARECMQISRRFGANIIPQQYMETLLDYCTRGKVEHLIRMRERLDEHARFLELQLAGLEMMILEKGGKEPEKQSEATVEQRTTENE